jgi:nucleotide-binding universal stress UspA family protein
MTIVCGTDLSAAAGEAAEAAARLAARRAQPLVLVHAIDELGAREGLALGEPQYEPVRRRLAEEADRLRGFGASVEAVVRGDTAVRSVLGVAAARDATLVVIAPVGERGYAARLLGSTAARIVARSPVPVLAVRAAGPARAWLTDGQPLRVTVGMDDTSAGLAALRWVEGLRRVARCDVTVVHVASPIEEQRRLGLRGPVNLEELSEEARRVLHRDVEQRVGRLAGEGDVTIVIRHGLGRVDADLADAAEQFEADLLVVGSHQWSGLDRVRRGSVSQAVVASATMSVACVPAAYAQAAPRSVPPVDAVLIATDLSPHAAVAVPHGYALVPDGGTVHLVTVTGDRHQHGELERQLEGLVPAEAPGRGVRTEIHVLEGRDAAEAIGAAAERLGVDVVCLGTHGRTGLAEVVLGSVAQDVLRRTRRPVLLVRREA